MRSSLSKNKRFSKEKHYRTIEFRELVSYWKPSNRPEQQEVEKAIREHLFPLFSNKKVTK